MISRILDVPLKSSQTNKNEELEKRILMIKNTLSNPQQPEERQGSMQHKMIQEGASYLQAQQNHLESLKKLAEDEESSEYGSEEGEEEQEEDNITDFYSKGIGFV